MYLTKRKQSPTYLTKCRIISIFGRLATIEIKNNVVYKMQVWREDKGGNWPPSFKIWAKLKVFGKQYKKFEQSQEF